MPVTAPGNWSGVGLGSSSLPSSAPGALGTSTLPVYTDTSYSLSQLTTSFPNTDTSTTDGYAGMYVLRLQTFQHNNGGTTTSYDSADISVNSSTGAWTLVYSPTASTTTTLETPTPASPQNAGTSVTLTATVTDASAPGSVQFESGGDPVGSPQPVVDGTATLTTTALPTGTDSLTAVYTPTTGAAFTGSTSTPVSYTVNAPTDPGAPTGVSATPGNASASVSFTPPASNGGSAITGYTVTATDITTPANGGQTNTGSTSPITVTGLTNGDSYTFTVTATNGVGTGPSSGASNTVTPATRARSTHRGLGLGRSGPGHRSFTAPASNGGSAITGYTVTAADTTTPANGGQTGTGHDQPDHRQRTHNGDSYTFTVTATNAVGTGAASSASNAGDPRGHRARSTHRRHRHGGQRPGQRQLHRAGLQRRVHHHRLHRDGDRPHHPANGGQTGTGTTSPITVPGLTNGDSYTFTVTATNGVGTGAASSAPRTRSRPEAVPGAPTGVSATPGNA